MLASGLERNGASPGPQPKADGEIPHAGAEGVQRVYHAFGLAGRSRGEEDDPRRRLVRFLPIRIRCGSRLDLVEADHSDGVFRDTKWTLETFRRDDQAGVGRCDGVCNVSGATAAIEGHDDR